MEWTDLFVVRHRRPGDVAVLASADEEAPAPPKAIGVFVTAQSIASFPVASGVVTGLWLLMQRLVPVWGSTPWACLISALIVGAAIVFASVKEPDSRPKDVVGWVAALLIGAINSALLALASMGVLAIV